MQVLTQQTHILTHSHHAGLDAEGEKKVLESLGKLGTFTFSDGSISSYGMKRPGVFPLADTATKVGPPGTVLVWKW